MESELQTIPVDIELGLILDEQSPAYGHCAALLGEVVACIPIVWEDYAEYCQSIQGGRHVLDYSRATVYDYKLEYLWWDETGEESQIADYHPSKAELARLAKLVREGH
jgi:hypothetical protein